VAIIRYTIGIPAAITMMVWVYTGLTTTSVSEVYWPQHLPTFLADFTSSLTDLPAIQQNYLVAIATTYLWLLYFIWDAKVAGMVTQSWFTVSAAMVLATVVLGPGGAVGAAFLWREYVITEKRHKGALTMDTVRDEGM
jgi:hypothetical protein